MSLLLIKWKFLPKSSYVHSPFDLLRRYRSMVGIETLGCEPVCSFQSKLFFCKRFFISSGLMNISHTCRLGGINAQRFHSCQILMATSLLIKVRFKVS